MPTKTSATTKQAVAKTPTQKVSTKKASTKVAVKKSATTPAPKVVAPAPKSKKVTKSPCAQGVCIECRVIECKPEQAFWVNQGPILHSVAELKEALKMLTDEQFAYHTKRNGNDFAAWVRDCFADDICAEKLERASTRTGAIRTLTTVCSCK